MNKNITFTVNGEPVSLTVEPRWTLLRVLRDKMFLTGSKEGCGEGECGSCTVLVDGKPVNSCLMLAVAADGKTITTIEGLSRGTELHPLQKAFIEKGAIQCGFCTPGMVMTAKSLLDKNPDASAEEIRQEMAGNLCRCTGYTKIVEAVQEVAGQLKGGCHENG
ncbi:(2Fe-2S)-binding protein [Desulforhopalus singaporensis]|uniref:Carbon-monoxide dehydrogenase small subunit n=1 Tax=Desulforhopalus singaporensis TaxID=91360 RepID=A0A1H0IS42_9BACT|nr:(2Fe-2S)-binding protein [Desulforhopalus singaporensis]SDO34289.1 carbon-monoxide dehydrogenase small subunit [Desulforhopalus singaporensis]